MAQDDDLLALSPRVERLAARLLGRDADDGVQEVLSAAHAARPRFRGESQLSTWFHRLAVRVLCRFRARRDAVRDRETPDDQLDARLPTATVAAWQATPFDAAVRREQRTRVLAAVDSLPPLLREVLLLRLEDLTHRELGEALGIPIGTVKSRMAAAMVQLAQRLQDLGEDHHER